VTVGDREQSAKSVKSADNFAYLQITQTAHIAAMTVGDREQSAKSVKSADQSAYPNRQGCT
jgi:hypothetical protein